jgi:hypothetical protein
MIRIRGGYTLARPLTLEQLSRRLACGPAHATALVDAHRFPHAFVDCDGHWRIPVADVDSYVRHTSRRPSLVSVNGDGVPHEGPR